MLICIGYKSHTTQAAPFYFILSFINDNIIIGTEYNIHTILGVTILVYRSLTTTYELIIQHTYYTGGYYFSLSFLSNNRLIHTEYNTHTILGVTILVYRSLATID